MLNHARGTTRKITDLQPGSVTRTLVEAPAVEIEELYLQFFNGLREAIPVATYLSFGFGILPPRYARGFVSVTAETLPTVDSTVELGTVFNATDGREYRSTEAVFWPAGTATVRIPIVAAAPGLSYNIAAGAINSSPAFDAGYSISNSTIDNGRDTETEAERAARFAEFIGSLSRGTNFACLAAAKTAQILDADGNIFEYVTRSGLDEIPGYVKIYIYSSRGVPSAELVRRGQLIIDGWKDEATGVITPGYRAGGVKMDVIAMSERAVPFSGVATMQEGYELTPAVIQKMKDVYASQMNSVQPGQVLALGEVVTSLLSVTGVKSVVPTTTQNIVCGVYEALTAGDFVITAP